MRRISTVLLWLTCIHRAASGMRHTVTRAPEAVRRGLECLSPHRRLTPALQNEVGCVVHSQCAPCQGRTLSAPPPRPATNPGDQGHQWRALIPWDGGFCLWVYWLHSWQFPIELGDTQTSRFCVP